MQGFERMRSIVNPSYERCLPFAASNDADAFCCTYDFVEDYLLNLEKVPSSLSVCVKNLAQTVLSPQILGNNDLTSHRSQIGIWISDTRRLPGIVALTVGRLLSDVPQNCVRAVHL